MATGAPDHAQARTLQLGGTTVTVHPDVGGRLGQIEVDGIRLLAGHSPAENSWALWGSYVLAPWSNRIAGGRFRFAAREWIMPSLVEDGSALHGLVHSIPWTVDAYAPQAARPSIDMHVAIDTPPFTARVDQHVALADDGLHQRLSLTNTGPTPFPAGLGIHPWFRRGAVRVPARAVWPAIAQIPTGPPRPVTPGEDLRQLREPPDGVDACYTDLDAASADIGSVFLSWDGPVTQVVVFTGVSGWVCVEPVTNANDGFNLFDRGIAGTGTIVLAPGAEMRVRYRFSWPGRIDSS